MLSFCVMWKAQYVCGQDFSIWITVSHFDTFMKTLKFSGYNFFHQSNGDYYSCFAEARAFLVQVKFETCTRKGFCMKADCHYK